MSAEASLRTLGSRLRLPEGWCYRAREPADGLVVRIEGEARVVQDDRETAYRRVAEGPR